MNPRLTLVSVFLVLCGPGLLSQPTNSMANAVEVHGKNCGSRGNAGDLAGVPRAASEFEEQVAKAREISNSSSVVSGISEDEGPHYWHFTAPIGCVIGVEVAITRELDVVVWILDSTGRNIETTQGVGESVIETWAITSMAGDHYLVITPNSGEGNYSLSLYLDKYDPHHDDEVNDSMTIPNSWDYIVGETLDADDTVDWWNTYLVPTAEPEVINISLVIPQDSNLEANLEVYYPNKSLFQKSNSSVIFTAKFDEATPYYFKVTRVAGEGNYQISTTRMWVEFPPFWPYTYILGFSALALYLALQAAKMKGRKRRDRREENVVDEKNRNEFLRLVRETGRINLDEAAGALSYSPEGMRMILYNLVGEGRLEGRFEGNTFVFGTGFQNFLDDIDEAFKAWEESTEKAEGKK
ncbi:MAG: hypothetical protein ACTSU5_02125 [Promethearchaeota archaeon]